MKTALLILDMINTLDFPEAPRLLKTALPAAVAIQKLRIRLRKKNIPVIFVNDNFGHWRSNWHEVYDLCTSDKSRGKEIAHLLKPEKDDYFILKPKHSGFFETALDALLKDLKVSHLVITGIAGNICVLFTANDGHMREYKITVVKDCVASNSARDQSFALGQFKGCSKTEGRTIKSFADLKASTEMARSVSLSAGRSVRRSASPSTPFSSRRNCLAQVQAVCASTNAEFIRDLERRSSCQR